MPVGPTIPFAAPVTARASVTRLVAMWLTSTCLVLLTGFVPAAHAATTMPPMLDINAQCEIAHRKNADAMSECVVAESEARADILRRWDKLPETTAAGCLKVKNKGKRLSYVTLAKCLGDDAADQTPAAARK